MSLAAVAVFWLARRLGLSPWLAVAMGAFTLAIPDMNYSAWILADPFAYPLVLAAVAAATAALDRPTKRSQVAFVALRGPRHLRPRPVRRPPRVLRGRSRAHRPPRAAAQEGAPRAATRPRPPRAWIDSGVHRRARAASSATTTASSASTSHRSRSCGGWVPTACSSSTRPAGCSFPGRSSASPRAVEAPLHAPSSASPPSRPSSPWPWSSRPPSTRPTAPTGSRSATSSPSCRCRGPRSPST